jgi:GNAT superfamily N-acetyltransferase
VTDSARIEFLEAEAWTQRVEAVPAEHRDRLGTRVRRLGGAVVLATPGADAAALNRTIGIGLDRPLDAPLLGEVNGFFREAGVPRWLVECGPDATIVGGPTTLTEQGGVLKTPTVKLVGDPRDVAAAPTGNVSVREIGIESADAYRSIVAAAFGLPELVEPDLISTVGRPGWHYYMAFDDERPIAGAAMFVRNEGAWFGVAGTSAAARNRGAQTALLAKRLDDAKRLGCSWVTAETAPDTPDRPNPSYRNMLRAGMRVAYLRDKYLFENNRA